MKKLIVFLFTAWCLPALAGGDDEGMWLPLLLKKYNYDQMKQMGLKLSAEQLYDVNNSSLKDAIVSLGGFCTGELVSEEGLMLTNHHCGYDAIASHSTVEKDYLSNGFWAMDRKQELQNPGLFADVLIRMEDVTGQVETAVQGMPEGEEKTKKYRETYKKIVEKATAGTHYKGRVVSVFSGGEYYLIVYERFKDVRLVGAPPSSIGKFGGDTDNWMWPRHTGDFSMFRIYADKDNKPAEYSPDNVPYKPKHVIPVSVKGYKENDFTMVYGYPGNTDRYKSSFGIRLAIDQTNPAIVALLGKRLEVMKSFMDADPKVRIMLASDYASISNSWKYYLGQSEGLKKQHVVAEKERLEKTFSKWVTVASDANKTAYSTVLENLAKLHADFRKVHLPSIYASQSLYSVTATSVAAQLKPLATMMSQDKPDKKAIEATAKGIKDAMKDMYAHTHEATDRKVLAEMLKLYVRNVPVESQLAPVLDLLKKYKGKTPDESFDKFAEVAYSKSVLTSQEKLDAFLDKPSYKVLSKDPLYDFYQAMSKAMEAYQASNSSFYTGLYNESKILIKGLREMNNTRNFYPDANSTLRFSFGKVLHYQPKDAVEYGYFTTLDGVMEKEDSSNEEFIVPARLKEIYEKKDYGMYALPNGDMPVAFISDNDITGGNSGSPVMNAEGHLVGIAFDGNWEDMSGDLVYNPDLKRCINVDIRYVLLVIDKFAGAGHLVKEMKLIK